MTWTTPANVTAGQDIDDNFWNGQVAENMRVIGGAWTSFTPTVTGWSLGNGARAAAYAQAGKWVRFRITLTLGSTTSTAATLGFTLPVAPHADWASAERWFARDISAPANDYGDADIFGGAAGINLRNIGPGWTWASGDFIAVTGEYEAA